MTKEESRENEIRIIKISIQGSQSIGTHIKARPDKSSYRSNNYSHQPSNIIHSKSFLKIYFVALYAPPINIGLNFAWGRVDLRGRICTKNFYRNFACKILNSKSYIAIAQDLAPCHRFHRKSLRPNSVAQEFCPNSTNGEISPRFTLMTHFHFISATYFAVYLGSSFCRKGCKFVSFAHKPRALNS